MGAASGAVAICSSASVGSASSDVGALGTAEGFEVLELILGVS